MTEQLASLHNLRPLHLPEAISFWPPAPGWYGLFLLILLVSIIASYFIHPFWRHRKIKSQALKSWSRIAQEFKHHQNKQLLLRQLSVLLRRSMLARYPRAEVAAVINDHWAKQLDHAANKSLFATGAGKVLLQGPYQNTVPYFDPDELLFIVKQWVKRAL